MGIFAPLTLKLRILLQNLWQLRIPWDETLPNSITQRFKQILGQIFALQNFRISRQHKPDLITGPSELHRFCDAGEQAYGAVIWLRWPSGQTYDLRFVASKAYVAPLTSHHQTKPKFTCFNSMMKAADKSALPEGSVITLYKNQFF